MRQGRNILAYRRNYRNLLRMLFFSTVIGIVLSLLLVYSVFFAKEQLFYSTSMNGRYSSLTPLEQPNLSDSAVLQWASEAATAAYSYDFAHYQEEIAKQAKPFFTPQGWSAFTDELERSNILDTVKAKKLIVSAVNIAPPVIVRKGVFFGRTLWRVSLPLLITFQSPSEFRQQKYYVMIQIERTSTLDNPRGIGITQFTIESTEGPV